MKSERDSLRNLEKDLEQKDRELREELGKFQVREKDIKSEYLKLKVLLITESAINQQNTLLISREIIRIT